MNLLNQSIKTHGYSSWYNYQFSPVVGAAASLPAGLMSGAQVITNLFRAAISFSNDKRQSSQCFWAARDLFIIFSNNLLNICTLGLLNSALLRAGLLEFKASSEPMKKDEHPKKDPVDEKQKADPKQHRLNDPLPFVPSTSKNQGAATALQNPSRGEPSASTSTPQASARRNASQALKGRHANGPEGYFPSSAAPAGMNPGAARAFHNPQGASFIPNGPASQFQPMGMNAGPSPAFQNPPGYFPPPSNTPAPQFPPMGMNAGPSPAFQNPPGYFLPPSNAPASQFPPMGLNAGPAPAPQNPSMRAPSHPTTPPPSMPQNKPLEKVVWLDAGSKQVQGSLRLAPGKQSIMLLHEHLQGYSKGAIVELITNQPIYGFSDARFGQMPKNGPCLVMHDADFKTIQQVIHPDAFGRDFSDIGNGYVAVWKIPADLLYIADYQPDSTPVDVGTYQLYDDLQNFADPFNLVNKVGVTKMRIDAKVGPYEADSVHYFTTQDPNKYILAGISTGSFFKDFNYPTQAEMKLVQNMLAELNQYGVGAFLCNEQHAVIFYTYTQNPSGPLLMLPSNVAHLLRDDRIFGAIQKAANKDLQTWRKTFIATFAQKN